MNMMLLSFFSVFSLLCFDKNGLVVAESLRPEIEFCHQSDPNFNICVATQMTKALKLFKDGAADLGIPKLEPFEVPKMEISGDPGSSVSMSQKYTNMLTYGIYKSTVYDGKFLVSQAECYWDLMVLTPNLRIEADYEINGQLLVFPVNGHGKSNFSITNLRNNHKVTCQLYNKKGDTYIKATKYEMDMSGEKISFYFENIVPGNQQLTDQIGKTINENSQEVFKETKFGFETVWSKLHLQVLNNVLAKYPAATLFPA